jgi:hypothetical protein
MEGLTVAGAMSMAAVLLTAGTLFFSSLALYAERDFWLMLGLVACVAGNVSFAFYLWEQGVEGEYTDALVANFGCMVLLSLYAMWVQFEQWREFGLGEPEDEEVDGEEEGRVGGGAQGYAGGAARPLQLNESVIGPRAEGVAPSKGAPRRRK